MAEGLLGGVIGGDEQKAEAGTPEAPTVGTRTVG
jgi:hypothetical protein